MLYLIKKEWIRFWMKFGAATVLGKIATHMALIPVGPFRHRYPLAALYAHGFTAPDAKICKSGLVRGEYAYIGSRVILFRQHHGGDIVIGSRVFLNDGCRLETGFGGSIEIGRGTCIQPDCQFSAYTGTIKIGENVQIAPRCAFYPYDHGVDRKSSMKEQPIVSRGGIVVQDDAWLGYGAIILDGVNIGAGAVVAAGAVVKDRVPDYAIAAGVPAKVIKMRP